jgi:type IV pilus assembly protein PilM
MSAVTEYVERVRGVTMDALSRLRPPFPPVAMEVDRNEVVLVRFKAKRGGKPFLEAQAVRPMPEDSMPSSIFDQSLRSTTELTARFQEMFELTGTRPGRISLVLPDNLAKVSLLTLPERPASQRQLDELVRSKMRRAVPFRLEEAAISYQVLPVDGRQVALLVLLTPRQLIDRFEQAFAALGARVGLIDIATPNLINLCRQRLEVASRDGKDVALLNCASNYFSLVIVRNGRLIFFRCKTLSPEGEAVKVGNGFLVREVASSLSYYREKLDGKGIESVLVRGLGVSVDEVAEKLRELDLGEVESIGASVDVDLAPGQRLDSSLAMRLAPAFGAAAAGIR